MSTTLNLEAERAALAAQPFSVLLGTVLTALDEDGAQLDLTIGEQLLQGRGFVHGGVLSYLADNALTYAAATVLGNSAHPPPPVVRATATSRRTRRSRSRPRTTSSSAGSP